MQLKKKTVNGETIEFREELHHEVRTKFDLWDRIKILFSGKITTHSVIYTMNENIKVVTSEANAIVIPMTIMMRRKRGIAIGPNAKQLAEAFQKHNTGNADKKQPPFQGKDAGEYYDGIRDPEKKSFPSDAEIKARSGRFNGEHKYPNGNTLP